MFFTTKYLSYEFFCKKKKAIRSINKGARTVSAHTRICGYKLKGDDSLATTMCNDNNNKSDPSFTNLQIENRLKSRVRYKRLYVFKAPILSLRRFNAEFRDHLINFRDIKPDNLPRFQNLRKVKESRGKEQEHKLWPNSLCSIFILATIVFNTLKVFALRRGPRNPFCSIGHNFPSISFSSYQKNVLTPFSLKLYIFRVI